MRAFFRGAVRRVGSTARAHNHVLRPAAFSFALTRATRAWLSRPSSSAPQSCVRKQAIVGSETCTHTARRSSARAPGSCQAHPAAARVDGDARLHASAAGRAGSYDVGA